jgi:hypothetical protein
MGIINPRNFTCSSVITIAARNHRSQPVFFLQKIIGYSPCDGEMLLLKRLVPKFIEPQLHPQEITRSAGSSAESGMVP